MRGGTTRCGQREGNKGSTEGEEVKMGTAALSFSLSHRCGQRDGHKGNTEEIKGRGGENVHRDGDEDAHVTHLYL